MAGGRAPTRRLNRGLESGEYLLREWYAPNLEWLRIALNELGARHLNCRAMSLYHSQPPADYGGFGEFNGFSFRHYLTLPNRGVSRHCPLSIPMPPALTSVRNALSWRYRRRATRSPYVAAAPLRVICIAWPTGWSPAALRPWPWHQPASTGSRSTRLWQRGVCRSCFHPPAEIAALRAYLRQAAAR